MVLEKALGNEEHGAAKKLIKMRWCVWYRVINMGDAMLVPHVLTFQISFWID